MDLQFLIFLFPAGVVLCFRELRDEHLFVIIYAVMASYFAGVMVRLILTLTPVVCVASAIALSTLIDTYADPTEPPAEDEQTGNAGAGAAPTNGSETLSKKDGPATLSKKAKKTAATVAPATPTSPAIRGVIADILSATGSISKGGSARYFWPQCASCDSFEHFPCYASLSCIVHGSQPMLVHHRLCWHRQMVTMARI